MLNILIVEDEKAVRVLTKAKLKKEYQVFEASNGIEALEVMDHTHIDLIIADIMMPKMDGYEFVAELREAGDMTPVILLTAMGSFEHKKKGFATGVDDYMTKPIDYEELLWRMEAILRRSKIANEKYIELDEFSISEETKAAFWQGEEIELTGKEFDLLYKFLSYPDVIFTKQQLMDEIWGYDTQSNYNTIKTYINRLRNKCKDCTAFEIVSIRGLGYKAVIQKDG